MKIDHQYLTFGLTVGVRNRIAIYNHMRAFLFDSISARGLTANDPELFNQLTIEQQALRLAEEVIAEVEHELADIFAEMIGFSPIDKSEAQSFAASCLIEAVDQKTAGFLADDDFGLTWLIHNASGVAPMTPESGLSLDGLIDLGPDRDRD